MNKTMLKILGQYMQRMPVRLYSNIKYQTIVELYPGRSTIQIDKFIDNLRDMSIIECKYNTICPYCGEPITIYDRKDNKCEDCEEFVHVAIPHEKMLLLYDINKEELADKLKKEGIDIEMNNHYKKTGRILMENKKENANENVKRKLDYDEVKIGIITALPKETAAVLKMMDNVQRIYFDGDGAGHSFWIGEIKAANSGNHFVALAQCNGMGNNNASVRVMAMNNHFHKLDSIIMTGIAGGIPNPENINKHVRLGDIVVSEGVCQYDMIKENEDVTELRSNAAKPSAKLQEAVAILKVLQYQDTFPWREYIDKYNKGIFKKPDVSTDKLYNGDIVIEHPKDQERGAYPKVFYGVIASANTLQKNRVHRDELSRNVGAMAIEMEASGIADATYNNAIGYIVIRGICDYCDSHKNDTWQNYAALVAAAYTKALIEQLPKF